MLEQLAAEMKDSVRIVGANIEHAGDVASNLGVMALPTLVFFKGGEEVHRLTGVVSKPKLLELMKKRLGT